MGGKGVVYVWAAGNGAQIGDYSNLDGLTNFYPVVAVCAVDNRGERSSYSESGANLWVCGPSSSARAGIATTTDFNVYTRTFGGTSAAAPIVSGVAALVRAANSNLTWRDVKLILAASARKNDPTDTGWEEGASKYRATGKYDFNHQYGFGVVDAKAAVDLADNWTNLPEFAEETVDSTGGTLTIPDDGTAVTSTVTMEGSKVQFIEFVEIKPTFAAPHFRDLVVELESPTGEVSILSPSLNPGTCARFLREYQVSCALGTERRPVSFRFGSAKHLGEDPGGEWTLKVTDDYPGGSPNRLKNWKSHRLRPPASPRGGRNQVAGTRRHLPDRQLGSPGQPGHGGHNRIQGALHREPGHRQVRHRMDHRECGRRCGPVPHHHRPDHQPKV